MDGEATMIRQTSIIRYASPCLECGVVCSIVNIQNKKKNNFFEWLIQVVLAIERLLTRSRGAN